MSTNRSFAEAVYQEEMQQIIQRCEALCQRVAYLADTLEDLRHRVDQMKINNRAANDRSSEGSMGTVEDHNPTALDLSTNYCHDSTRQSPSA